MDEAPHVSLIGRPTGSRSELSVQPWKASQAPLRLRLESGAHLLVDQVDGLQRTQHDFEFDDLSFVVPLQQIDSVDLDAFQLQLEPEDRVSVTLEFADVAEGLIEENVEGRREI